MRCKTDSLWLPVLLVCLISMVANAVEAPVDGDAFVVETRVFFGEAAKPAVRTTTVFTNGKAFDQMAGADRALFDFDKQTVTLFSTSSRSRTTISFGVILECQAVLLERVQQREGLGAFLARPQFIHEFDGSSTITLSSPWMTYAAHGKQTISDRAARFLEFADWSARLASLVNPLAPPAQPRLELNAALKKRNWQVDRITRSGGPRARQQGEVRSEHGYRNELSPTDRDLIEGIQKDLKTFRQISFSEYRTLQNSAATMASE